MRRRRHAVLGGTFDRFHVGHAALLARAFSVGRNVSIGVTTDRYVRDHPKPDGGSVQPYRVRARTVRRWLAARYPRSRWTTVPLEDRFGRSVEEGVSVLVVSAETLEGGRAVNAERRRRGRRAVPIEVVPLVLADDLQPVSARRIRRGEIDAHGHRRARIRVGALVEESEDGDIVRAAVRQAFPTARLVLRVAGRGRGGSAGARAGRLAVRALARGDLGLGLARAPGGRWVLVERSPFLALDPFRGPAGSAAERTRALAGRLRPTVGRNAFALPRPLAS